MSLRDIIGQNHAIDILKGAVSKGRIAHAYLFLGPEGVGKKKTALEFARLLNCQTPSDNDCCNSCAACSKIKNLSHPDIFFVAMDKGKTEIPIDRIRQLQHDLSLKTLEAEYRVVIIVGADCMSQEASNCLLKLLEEPTPGTVFILTSSNQTALLQTIVSRCQIIRFATIPRNKICAILKRDFSMDEKEANFLAAISDGNVKKALSLKETELLLWKNKVIDEFQGRDLLSGREGYSMLGDQRGVQIEAIDVLLGFWRDIMVYKFVKEPQLLINIDRIDSIIALAEKISAEKIQAYIREIEDTRELLQSNINTKLAIRVLKEKLVL